MAYPKAGEPDSKFNGLTKRESFASIAMQGYLASPTTKGDAPYAGIALAAVQMADALIAELSK